MSLTAPPIMERLVSYSDKSSQASVGGLILKTLVVLTFTGLVDVDSFMRFEDLIVEQLIRLPLISVRTANRIYR